MHFLSATETAAVPDGVSVLRLFRGLGLRGVQILAACFLGEKGLLWYAPDQQRDARDGETNSLTAAPSAELEYRLSKENLIRIKTPRCSNLN